jgi:hypothetical protein
LAGALIGQVHLSGWFVAMGLVIGTAIAECRGRPTRSRTWSFWLAGSVLGLLTAIPWALALRRSPVPSSAESLDSLVLHRAMAYLYGLVAAGLGVLPSNVLGLGHDTADFERWPIVHGIRTYVPAWLYLFIIPAVLGRIVARLIDAIVKPGIRWASRMIALGEGDRPKQGGTSEPEQAADAGEGSSSTGFYLWSTIVIPGLLFLLTTDVYFYHYFFVLCPFLYVGVAALMLPWRRTLFGLVLAQALMGYAYLSYIHQKGGTVNGEYGSSYARQMTR